MLIIEYNPNRGIVVPDAEVLNYASMVIQSFNALEPMEGDFEIEVASELLVNAFKVCVKRGLVDHKKVLIKFQDLFVKVAETGKEIIPDEGLPNGYCDASLDLCLELI